MTGIEHAHNIDGLFDCETDPYDAGYAGTPSDEDKIGLGDSRPAEQ